MAPIASVTEDARPRNAFLARMSRECIDWLMPRLTTMTLTNGQVIHPAGARIEHVFFPDAGLVSIVSGRGMASHGIEVGMVGREGFVGIAAVLDNDPTSFLCALVQMPGSARKLSVADLHECARLFPPFQHLCLRFVQAQVAQFATTAVCNGLHTLMERCARWILMSDDRMRGTDVPLTQEFLASMLGARRSGVTVAAGALRRAGFIRYSRGRIHIQDRAGLESACCACYRQIVDEFDRLLP